LLAAYTDGGSGVPFLDVVENSGTTRSLASESLVVLESAGLVAKHTPERDQRRTVVYLTDAGRSKVIKMIAALSTLTLCEV